MSNIFEKRINYKPFEYPQLKELWELIEKTFWTVSEINFTADVNDYLVNLNSTEQSIFRKSLLGIAQIEVGVKTFWGKLYDSLPKPEINNLGSTYAHNESIHSEAYSELLSVLGLELEFANIRQIPALYNKYLFIEEKLNTNDIVDKTFFFTIGIENTSLFSLFSNILSFTRFKGLMKNTSNIIAWSSAEEDTHARAGITILNIIFNENPKLKEKYTQEYVENLCKDYIKVEIELLDWIYSEGELGFFTKNDMINFMKYRLDSAIEKMGYSKIFNISNDDYKPMKWFDEEVYSNTLDDFFSRRPVDYTKKDKSFDVDDIFDDF
jgi:ribonucleoside-diphosphate reductase beta chain